jgi:hypothetical protein
MKLMKVTYKNFLKVASQGKTIWVRWNKDDVHQVLSFDKRSFYVTNNEYQNPFRIDGYHNKNIEILYESSTS